MMVFFQCAEVRRCASKPTLRLVGTRTLFQTHQQISKSFRQFAIENFPIGRCHFLAEMELYLPTQSSAEGSLLIACFAVRTEHRGFGKGDEGYFASLGIGQLHAPPGRISTKELASTHESLGHFDCVEASHGNVW